MNASPYHTIAWKHLRLSLAQAAFTGLTHWGQHPIEPLVVLHAPTADAGTGATQGPDETLGVY